MADRKQFSSVAQVSERLTALLTKARSTRVTNEVLEEQRVSFAFGNAPKSDRITRETVLRSSQHVLMKD